VSSFQAYSGVRFCSGQEYVTIKKGKKWNAMIILSLTQNYKSLSSEGTQVFV